MTGSGSAFFAPLAKVRKYPDLPFRIFLIESGRQNDGHWHISVSWFIQGGLGGKVRCTNQLELPVENETPLIVHTWNGVKETNLPCVIATDSWLAEKYHLEPHVDATSNIAETLTNAAQELDTEFLLVLSADMPFVSNRKH